MRRSHARWPALLALVAFVSACTGPLVYAPTTPRPAPSSFAGALVVETDYETSGLRIPELEAALIRALDASRTADMVFDGRRLDAAAAQGPAFHVGFRITNYRISEANPPPGAIAVIALGSLLIVPFAFVGVPRIKTEYWIDYEVTVRSLQGVPLTVVVDANGGQPHFDVSAVPPSFRRSYRVQVYAARNWLHSEMGNGTEAQRHWYEITDQMGIRMVNEALPDLAAVLSTLR